MHKEWDYGSGVIKEKVIGKGARVDGIDYVNRIVYELKPIILALFVEGWPSWIGI